FGFDFEPHQSLPTRGKPVESRDTAAVRMSTNLCAVSQTLKAGTASAAARRRRHEFDQNLSSSDGLTAIIDDPDARCESPFQLQRNLSRQVHLIFPAVFR